MRDAVLRVAEQAGYETGLSGAWGWIRPCPECGADTRHSRSGDRRGAVAVSPDGVAWCVQCDARPTRWRAMLPSTRLVAEASGAGYPPLSAMANFYARYRDEQLYPLYDPAGVERSAIVRFRDPSGGPKSMSPAGYRRSGLCMVGDDMLEILRAGFAPRVCVTILEGESDFDAYTRAADSMCLGIVSGSWTPDWVAAMPLYATLLIATDLDEQGDRYAQHIVDTCQRRMRFGTLLVRRWSPPQEFLAGGGNDIRDYYAWRDSKGAHR